MTARPEYRTTGTPAARSQMAPMYGSTDSLADILERVLDKGIVIAGDIMVNVLDIELLTLKIRLLVASVDTARDMGIDWWTSDPFLTGRSELEEENNELRRRVEQLEEQVRAGLPAGRSGSYRSDEEEDADTDADDDDRADARTSRRPRPRPRDRAPR